MFEISQTPLDTDKLEQACHDARAGALVVFEGRVRDNNEGRAVNALEYEAYASMACSEGEKILAEQQPTPRWKDEVASQVNNLRTRVLMGKADVVIALFGDKYSLRGGQHSPGAQRVLALDPVSGARSPDGGVVLLPPSMRFDEEA